MDKETHLLHTLAMLSLVLTEHPVLKVMRPVDLMIQPLLATVPPVVQPILGQFLVLPDPADRVKPACRQPPAPGRQPCGIVAAIVQALRQPYRADRTKISFQLNVLYRMPPELCSLHRGGQLQILQDCCLSRALEFSSCQAGICGLQALHCTQKSFSTTLWKASEVWMFIRMRAVVRASHVS